MKSASNREIKLLRKLARKKYRDKENLFVVEGERAVEQVLENGILTVEQIFISDAILRSGYPAECKRIEHDLFIELADTEQTQGILALCKKPEVPDMEVLMKTARGPVLATDAIQDPGNMGTIIRTASWYGADCLVAGSGSVDIYHPKVVRSTAGATGTVPALSAKLLPVLESFREEGWTILLMDGGEGSGTLNAYKDLEKLVLVVGNEGNGISSELMEAGFQRVGIERRSDSEFVESLNAAVAAAIALDRLSGD